MEQVIIKPEAFNPYALLQEYEAAQVERTQFGATSVFVGSMRDFNEGNDVASMVLEHYPGMTEGHLSTIIDEAKAQFDIMDAFIVHRIGEVHPGDTLVLAAVWSAHRNAAFEASRYLVESLKHRAPFWKKEQLKSGETRWVASNTAG